MKFLSVLPRFGVIVAAAAGGLCSASAAHIVKEGIPKAEIVVALDRPRMTTLAALELQHYLKKISGAELPIVTEPAEGSVRIYVGKSSYTDKLGIETGDLKYGAYRMVSGGDYLALLGQDTDFTPPVPAPTSRADIPRAEAEWDAIVSKVNDVPWGFPFRALYKEQYKSKTIENDMTRRYGTGNAKLWPGGNFSDGFWAQDEGGSVNAVFGYLRSLGLRLYMPGDLGEVVPEKKTIPLPELKETVKPAYALRAWKWYNMVSFPFESVLWYRQIGNNSGEEILGPSLTYAHGLGLVLSGKDFKEKYPKAFALLGTKRDMDHRGFGTPCPSSEELIDQTVKYARFLFDRYDMPQVSVWPTDGFKPCQCELCAGKEPSELVWTFVNRVATELYRTHPDRLVTCGAYTLYKLAPPSIEKFSPNVGVFISNHSRPMFMDPASWNSYWKCVEDWRSKLAPDRILRVENNRYSLGNEAGGFKDPFLVPQAPAIVKELKALNGISLGEISEQSQSKGQMVNPAVNSFPLYVMARWFWSPEADYQSAFDEYLTDFFGPAREDMRKVFEFAEEAYLKATTAAKGKTARNPDNVPLKDRIKLVEMLLAARETAGNNAYGERIDGFLNELESLENLRVALEKQKQAGDPRDKALVVAVPATGKSSAIPFRDIVTSAEPAVGTALQVSREGNALVFTVRCEEPDMANLQSVANVSSGDSLAILLEPPGHSYYQIEVNPDGVTTDNDIGSEVGARWKSQAQVRTERGKDFWLVEVKIPVVDLETGAGDPYHNVVGAMPSVENPWYLNIGRHRPREGGTEVSMISPTGKKVYHDVDRFARLVPSETAP